MSLAGDCSVSVKNFADYGVSGWIKVPVCPPPQPPHPRTVNMHILAWKLFLLLLLSCLFFHHGMCITVNDHLFIY